MFINDKMSQAIINQDINFLLSYEKFKALSKTLKMETLTMLEDEIKKLSQKEK
jgi:hypothetical protein